MSRAAFLFKLILACGPFAARAFDPAGAAIDRARGLARLKDRVGACAVLSQALADTPVSAKPARARLIEALNQVSRVFFSDKGQRAFEGGQSMMFENPEMAIARFASALETEDRNLTLLESLAETHLFRGEIDLAEEPVARGRLLNPAAAEVALLDLALQFEKTSTVPPEKTRLLPALDHRQDIVLQYLQALGALAARQTKKAFDFALRVTEADPRFPGGWYALGRSSTPGGRASESALRRYALLCKTIGPRDRRRYAVLARQCARQKEVEDELARRNSDG